VSDQTTLAACPFCGGEACISDRAATDYEGGEFVAFAACYCGGYAATAHQFAKGGTPAEAIANVAVKWNRRASANGDVSNYIASLVAERDELREALTGLLSLLDAGIESASVSAFLTPIDAARKALSAKEPT
jgi:hypothetical protein